MLYKKKLKWVAEEKSLGTTGLESVESISLSL